MIIIDEIPYWRTNYAKLMDEVVSKKRNCSGILALNEASVKLIASNN
nr:hypothetical protein [uncultured Flavobacterium sp.]